MFLRSLTGNSGSRRSTAAGLAAAVSLAALLSGGCGERRRSQPVPPPPAEPAYVSLERLARQHPLWDDLQRLEGAARRLENPGAGRGVPAQGQRLSGYTLPELALPAAPQNAADAPLAQLRKTGEMQRLQLARRLQRLRDRELVRRRADLEAASEREQARRARELLEGTDISARFRKILVQISEDPSNEVLKKVAPVPPQAALLGSEQQEPLDRYAAAVASVRAWIAALGSALNLGLIPETRAVVESRLAAARTTLSQLLALEQQARRQAEREAAVVLQQAARQDRSRVDAEIVGLRRQYALEIAERVQRERARLDDDLAMVQRLSRTLQTTAADEATARPYVVPLPGQNPGRSRMDAQAVGRVREQRDRLWRFLLADVQTAVRDAASVRNIHVSFSSNNKGAPDRTAEFARWIGYEGQGTGERKK